MGKFNLKVEPPLGMDCVRLSRVHCIGVFITESTGLLAVSYQVLCTDIRWSKYILIDI